MSASQRDHQFGAWAAAWMKLHPAVDVAFAANALAAELALVDARLGVEVARGADGEVEVIVTAFSEPALFDTVDRLVWSVESTPGWRWVALKPGRGFSFDLELGQSIVSAANLRFAPIAGVRNGFAIQTPSGVSDRWIQSADAEEAAWLVVETGIGERAASRIEHLEFRAELVGPTWPIQALVAHLAAA